MKKNYQMWSLYNYKSNTLKKFTKSIVTLLLGATCMVMAQDNRECDESIKLPIVISELNKISREMIRITIKDSAEKVADYRKKVENILGCVHLGNG